MISLPPEVQRVDVARRQLEAALNQLLSKIGDIPIGTPNQFPFGWRKAAKGRTVWRLLEEVISQNLEACGTQIGLDKISPANSEVGVYDFSYSSQSTGTVFVNIKSAVEGAATSKDDVSKARSLEAFYKADPTRILLIATIHIQFLASMAIHLLRATVMPVSWIPDIYVNPSNNGNLQSSHCKSISRATMRTGADFLSELQAAIRQAEAKRKGRATP